MTEDPWAEEEAAETARFDADLEMAEMNRAGDALHAAMSRGVCCHTSAQGYSGGPRSAAQEGLRAGEVRCAVPNGCGRVFADDEAWLDAMDAAICGDDDQ
jgi:hypothetical protein